MTYTTKNFRSKKALKDAIKAGEEVTIYEPSGREPAMTGVVYLEGPHYPEAHRWYAQAKVENGAIVSVK